MPSSSAAPAQLALDVVQPVGKRIDDRGASAWLRSRYRSLCGSACATLPRRRAGLRARRSAPGGRPSRLRAELALAGDRLRRRADHDRDLLVVRELDRAGVAAVPLAVDVEADGAGFAVAAHARAAEPHSPLREELAEP